ncbi:deoxyribose-phosphate aldolase [Halobacteriales archaeon QS_1_68_17]|nr:MAG: deoxyribose-phosphate aldolase [Halobacteriales archaeon QS_1_68_17]
MDDVPGRIDHTVLGPETTWEDVTAVLDAAAENGMNACIPPCYAPDAADYAPGVTLVTVVGFPHGQHATATKAAEAEAAWRDGADELDVVCNLGYLLDGDDEAFRRDVAEVVAAVPVTVKVIVQSPRLTAGDVDRAGRLAADAGADFLKTATGFADGGATVPDVERLAAHLPVKASGGVGSWPEAAAMFDAGAERIGASGGVAIVEEWREAE